MHIGQSMGDNYSREVAVRLGPLDEVYLPTYTRACFIASVPPTDIKTIEFRTERSHNTTLAWHTCWERVLGEEERNDGARRLHL